MGSQSAREAATVMVAMHLGVAVLQGQIVRRMEISQPDQASAPSLGLIMLDVYAAMGQWTTSQTGLEARRAVEDYVQRLS